ncbi:MAG: hypothetical protein ABI165_07845, partial [Bryobacteraceae bacterium]
MGLRYAALVLLLAAGQGVFGASVTVNGICQGGNCGSADIIPLGAAGSTGFSFTYTLANTDRYLISGTFIGGHAPGPDYSIPFTAIYMGNASGTTSGADVLTIDFLQSYQYTRPAGSFYETLHGGFKGPLDRASSVQGRTSVSGHALAGQGPFSPPANFSVTSGNQAISGLSNPVVFDVQRIFTFGAGSGVGAAILNAETATVSGGGNAPQACDASGSSNCGVVVCSGVAGAGVSGGSCDTVAFDGSGGGGGAVLTYDGSGGGSSVLTFDGAGGSGSSVLTFDGAGSQGSSILLPILTYEGGGGGG